MYFGRNSVSTNVLSMFNGSQIEYVEQCTHLDTIIYS